MKQSLMLGLVWVSTASLSATTSINVQNNHSPSANGIGSICSSQAAPACTYGSPCYTCLAQIAPVSPGGPQCNVLHYNQPYGASSVDMVSKLFYAYCTPSNETTVVNDSTQYGIMHLYYISAPDIISACTLLPGQKTKVTEFYNGVNGSDNDGIGYSIGNCDYHSVAITEQPYKGGTAHGCIDNVLPPFFANPAQATIVLQPNPNDPNGFKLCP